jgi:cell division septation protein DedD
VKLPETKPEEGKPLMPPSAPAAPVKEQVAPSPPRAETPEGAVKTAEAPKAEVKLTETPRETVKTAEAPLPEKKPARQQTAKAEEPKGKGERRYTIQVASLVMERNVPPLKERLEKLGHSPVIRKTTALITRHWVRVGEFTSREEVEGTARRLNVDGFPSNIVDLGQGKFTLEIGSAFQLNDAIDLAHSLQKKNYTPKIVSKPTPTPVHQVRVGEYGDRAEALQVIEELKKQGFAPVLVQQ